MAGLRPASSDPQPNPIEQFGKSTCTVDASSYCTITHNLGVVPAAVFIEGMSPSSGGASVMPTQHMVDQVTATTFRLRVWGATGVGLANVSITVWWHVDAAAAPPPPTTSTPPPTTTSPTPTPTPTTTPPPGGFHAAGQDANASTTGIAGDSVTTSQLTPSGGVTYGSAFNGQTISLKAYTGSVSITGSNITVKDCTITNGGLNSVGIQLNGDHNTVQNCKITAPAGQSLYEPIWIFGDHNSAINNDVSRGENLLTTYGTNATISGNYMHDVALDSNPDDHPDGIEVYGGGPTNISGNRIEEDSLYDSPINVAPYNSNTVTGLTVSNNFLDNGQSMTLVDNQSTAAPGLAGVQNVKVVHNAMGGHSNPDTGGSFGIYKALENYENRPIVQDDAALAANPSAIEWPTSGPNANYWEETQTSPALSPNRDDQIVLPSCPSPC